MLRPCLGACGGPSAACLPYWSALVNPLCVVMCNGYAVCDACGLPAVLALLGVVQLCVSGRESKRSVARLERLLWWGGGLGAMAMVCHGCHALLCVCSLLCRNAVRSKEITCVTVILGGGSKNKDTIRVL